MGSRLVTAVALYGPKSGPLRGLLETVQDMLRKRLHGGFLPYSLDQIHGTVIRLDGVADTRAGGIVNQRYLDFTGTPRAMDHARAWRILAAHLTPALSIRIGGFPAGIPARFTSRGQHPYERTFSRSGDAFVLMGWPAGTIVRGTSHRPLDELRRDLAQANIRHWYHTAPDDIDNDFHLVVGHYRGVAESATAAAVGAVRAHLARHPVQIAVGVDQLRVVAADSPTLAPAQFVGRIPVDPADLAGLYR